MYACCQFDVHLMDPLLFRSLTRGGVVVETRRDETRRDETRRDEAPHPNDDCIERYYSAVLVCLTMLDYACDTMR
jgi:hypothetical protein